MIKENLTEIHIHLIPGVDDGADSYETARAMIECAYNEGVRNIIATPHSASFDDRRNPVIPVFNKLKEKTRADYPDLELMLGAEVYVEKSEIKRVIRKLKHGKYPAMNNTSYVLTELPLSSDAFDEAQLCISRLIDAGFSPIIAHAERYLFSVEQICELKEMGALIQLNYCDIIPRRDYPMTIKAAKILGDEMADFLASDAHNMCYRSPDVSEALEYLDKMCSETYLKRILYENPGRVIRSTISIPHNTWL